MVTLAETHSLILFLLVVTVQCLKEGHFILVVSRDMPDYPVVLDTVKLSYAQEGSCDPERRTEAFVVFRFPLAQCGTTAQVRRPLQH